MKIFVCIILCGFGLLKAGELEVEKKKFLAADKLLDEAYKSARKGLRKGLSKELQEDQREWVSYRDEMSRVETDKQEEKEEQAVYWTTMTSISQDRVRVLKGWLNVEKGEIEWDGVYSDSFGGIIILKREGDHLHFKIEVERGLASLTGEIEDVAEINESAARYSDEGTRGRGNEKTWIDFKILDGARVKVEGVNTRHYHSAHASFDGTYVRLEPSKVKR